MANATLLEKTVQTQYFDAREQARLDHDDTEAFSRVSAILLSIVTAGLALIIFSLAAIIGLGL